MTKINTHLQRGKSAEQRFAEKHGCGEGCWLWTSAKNPKGYGVFYVSKERPCENAHRFALELKLGRPLADGATVMHSCDNPSCVNPSHLSEGTPLLNMIDAKEKGRLAIGERNGGGGKLTLQQAKEIFKDPEGCTRLARRYAVSSQTIKAIRRGRIWKEAAHG